MKMKIKSYFLILFFSLILVNSIYAQKNIYKCSCETYIDTIKIGNPYPYSVEFKIENYGSGEILADKNFGKVILPPQQTIEFQNKYDSRCNVFGNYDVYTEIIAATGEKNVVHREIFIEQCEKLEVDINNEKSVCESENNIIDLEIKNNGNYDEKIDVEIINYEGDYQLYYNGNESDGKDIEIKARDSENLELVFWNRKSGNYDASLKIISKLSKQEIEEPIKLIFEKCYDINAWFEADFNDICEDENDFTIIVNNQGTKDQDLNLDIKSELNQISLDDNDINIQSDESQKLNFKYDTKEYGKDTISLIDINNNKTLVSKKTEIISSYDCKLPEIEDNYFRVNRNSKGFSIKIINEGIRKADYKAYEYEEYTNFSYEFSLNPNEEYNLFVPNNNLSVGDYYLGLYIETDNNVYKKDINFKIIENKKIFENFFNSWIFFVIVFIIMVLILFFVIKANKRHNNQNNKKTENKSEKSVKSNKRNLKKKKSKKNKRQLIKKNKKNKSKKRVKKKSIVKAPRKNSKKSKKVKNKKVNKSK